MGQILFVMNSAPERSFYWKLSVSPERYIAVTNAPPEHGYYVATFNGKYVLWREGKEITPFRLPLYSTSEPATVWRAALTPISVVVDTARIATAVGAALVIGAAAAGASGGGIPHV